MRRKSSIEHFFIPGCAFGDTRRTGKAPQELVGSAGKPIPSGRVCV
uniref:Uncharacterized protein n=1 Tax=Anopheles dirus TaxID=7168 RepID=A0A182NWJ1_9DIPT